MNVLSIVSTKGGVGKTTLALHLAVEAHANNKATLVLDLDQQGSAAQWWKDRQRTLAERGVPASALFDVRRVSENNLPKTLEQAGREGFDLVVIDTPPHAEFPAARAVEVADLVLMPSRPGYFDLHAAKPTIALVRSLKKSAFFVMNQVPHNSQQIGFDASEFLEAKGIPRAPHFITLLQPFVRCLREGLTASEILPEGRPANEVSDLYRWVAAQLEIARMMRPRVRAAAATPSTPPASLLGEPFAHLRPVGEGEGAL